MGVLDKLLSIPDSIVQIRWSVIVGGHRVRYTVHRQVEETHSGEKSTDRLERHLKTHSGEKSTGGLVV